MCICMYVYNIYIYIYICANAVQIARRREIWGVALHTHMHTSAVRFVYGLRAGRQRRHYYEGLHGK